MGKQKLPETVMALEGTGGMKGRSLGSPDHTQCLPAAPDRAQG